MDRPLLSVIVPCFNEEEGVGACHGRLTTVLSGITDAYEVLYIDDGSTDNTAQLLQSIHEKDAHAVVLRLSRNFGHQPAVSAGLDATRGQAVVIIDADLQDPPELIPEMVKLWQSGYQVVYGIRQSRQGESAFKLWTAKGFYRLINRLSDIDIPLDTGDFRLLDDVVVTALRAMPERHRLLRGMASWIGYSQVGLPYHRSERFAGTTKYPLKKMLSLAADGIISFSTVPLQLMSILGFGAAGIAFLGVVYSIFVRIFTQTWVKGWALSFIAMMFMFGVQMLCLGILGEYVGRIYTESKQRPLYLVRETLRSAGNEVDLS
jgi:dolichol-phosphate mannosyltransferase